VPSARRDEIGRALQAAEVTALLRNRIRRSLAGPGFCADAQKPKL